VHWESYLLLQNLKKEKNQINSFCEIIYDLFLSPDSAPLSIIKSGRQLSVLHGCDYLARSHGLTATLSRCKGSSDINSKHWLLEFYFLRLGGETRLCLLGGKCFCLVLSPIRERLQAYKSEKRIEDQRGKTDEKRKAIAGTTQ